MKPGTDGEMEPTHATYSTGSPPLAPPATAAPLGFTAGFLLLAVALGLSLAALRLSDDGEDLARWSLLAYACPFASYVLLLAGGLEMLRTTVGPARAGAKLAVAATSLLLASSATASYLQMTATASVVNATEWSRGLWEAASWLSTTSWHGLTAAVALIAWRSPRARLLALLAVPCSLVGHPYAFVYQVLHSSALFHLAGGAQLLLLWMALRASVPEPEPFGGWLRTGQAIARLGKAMSLRVTFAAFSFALSILYGAMAASATVDEMTLEMVRPRLSDPLLTLNLFAGPAGVVLATALAISAALSAGGLATFLAPRRRFYAAAALFTVILSVRVVQLLVTYYFFPNRTSVALPVLLPMFETAALALLVLGCRRLAEQLESAEVIEQAAHTWLVLKVAQSFAVIAPLFVVGTAGVDGMAGSAPGLAVLLASAAPIVTMFSLSRLCRALAKQIELRGELPTAVVTS